MSGMAFGSLSDRKIWSAPAGGAKPRQIAERVEMEAWTERKECSDSGMYD